MKKAGWVAFGLFWLVAAISIGWLQTQVILRGVDTQGTVTQLIGCDEGTCDASVRFEADRGTIVARVAVDDRTRQGDVVAVRYVPGNPTLVSTNR